MDVRLPPMSDSYESESDDELELEEVEGRLRFLDSFLSFEEGLVHGPADPLVCRGPPRCPRPGGG